MDKNKSKNNKALIAAAVIFFVLLFVCVFLLTLTLYNSINTEEEETATEEISASDSDYDYTEPEPQETAAQTTAASETTAAESTTAAETTAAETTASSVSSTFSSTLIDFPSDTSSWQLICLNTSRRVSSSVENTIALSYVAGSSQQMDYRAAAAYEKMYAAAAEDGIYLTPCSGYRSYSTQERLYNEFVTDYLNAGYSQSEAEKLASTRRMPAGSSEHNIGICMDIITASSSYGFENTAAYAWLCENGADYGFILRYPSDKTDITGVKFEPWHWRYVGTENARSIQNSGLCLEEYLGLA
ncbi:MAG: M15 family metallopeptidase [Clostridiales bacterium]|nr:M15 family metallopeptidase [Clostridiales bacterium]